MAAVNYSVSGACVINETAIDAWAVGLLAAVRPQARRKLAITIATALRASQQARIATQRNPDGSAYTSRRIAKVPKKKNRAKKGRIKRGAMFKKLRSSRYLRLVASSDEAGVELRGQVARIAIVHQDGLVDNVHPKGPLTKYPVRQLLGFTNEDRELIQRLILENLR